MSGIRNFKKVESEDQILTRVQQKLVEFFSPFIRSAIIDGTLITNTNIVTGQANLVEHKLGRKIQGWLVIRQRSQADIWDAQDQNSLSVSTLDLRSSANVVVDLWIF